MLCMNNPFTLRSVSFYVLILLDPHFSLRFRDSQHLNYLFASDDTIRNSGECSIKASFLANPAHSSENSYKLIEQIRLSDAPEMLPQTEPKMLKQKAQSVKYPRNSRPRKGEVLLFSWQHPHCQAVNNSRLIYSQEFILLVDSLLLFFCFFFFLHFRLMSVSERLLTLLVQLYYSCLPRVSGQMKCRRTRAIYNRRALSSFRGPLRRVR